MIATEARPGPIAVIGLGYVGCVEAAVLAASGTTVIGVDRRQAVVDAIAEGREPIVEPGLGERIAAARALGTLRATTDLASAVASSVGALVCVGTPRGPNGELDERDVLEACESIARAVPPGASYVIVVRSTVPPGLYGRARARIATALAERGVRSSVALALNPEFLREGSAVRDREEPELVVYATEDDAAAELVQSIWAAHADRLPPGGIVRTDPASAEVLKLVANAWHALKVSFANEVARIARPIGVDPFEVMELLCRDRKLNTSAAYLRPGMPFGGACLVKDVSALEAFARAEGVSVPVLAGVLGSNRAHLDHIVAAVLARAPKRVAVIGIGFKPGAADVRDSAPVTLVQALLDAGLDVAVSDSAVLDARVPPLGLLALEAALDFTGSGTSASGTVTRARAVASVAEAVEGADVVVVAHPSELDRRALVALWAEGRGPRGVVLDAGGELSRKLTPPEREALAPVIVLRAGRV
ncbi:MAG: nucleotide sugar dehydrogenase [Myxococcota bacterium]|nr:nucleotide sugar dehydrogenase [Myxococcota bacterium]